MAEELKQFDPHEDIEVDRDLIHEEDLEGGQESQQDLHTTHLTVRGLGQA